MDEKPCCSASASDSAAGVMEEAKKLMGTGQRHLVMGDVVSAVAALQEACAILAKRYGDTADECGEAFFVYGMALLELARLENTVLGNALDGLPEEESEGGEKPDNSKIESADNVDETRAELREEVYDAMSEKEAEKSKMDGEMETSLAEDREKSSEKEDSEEKGTEVKGKKAPSKEQQKEGEAEKIEDDGGEGGGDDSEADEDKENEEEVGNLQLAWEMLEVAKIIYKRKENKDGQLLVAQAHLKLGEISVESGNYSQALEDFQKCLDIQLKHLPSHSRMLAETHYQLGLTFDFASQYNKAIQHFNNSIEVIESRLAFLQEAIDKADGPESAVEEQKEMEELKQLLPDIREKVKDAQESQKTAAIASEAIQKTLTGHSSGFPTENGATSSMATTSTAGASSSKSASDISHLVRQKRKPEESPVKNVDSKRAKQEAALNSGENTC